MEVVHLRRSIPTTLSYALYLILSLQCNLYTSTDTPTTKTTDDIRLGETTVTKPNVINTTQDDDDVNTYCPSNVDCHKLGPECIDCLFNDTCVYGLDNTVECRVAHSVQCKGLRAFKLQFNCRYCYQLDAGDYECNKSVSCPVTQGPRQLQRTLCSVNQNVHCMGQRKFFKRVPCNWSSGYKWSTALILSITMGGFGADRFYLGLWKEGIGKLFSFGGLGVWTIVDVILVAIGYVTPADGSLYL